MGCPCLGQKPTHLELTLSNGSRIVSLPENEEGIRGFSSVALLVIDEAARVSDELYLAVRPMLAVSHGRLIALSTPFGRRGWFYEEWIGINNWNRTQIPATEVPRISKAFLEEERRALGERWFGQEYLLEFNETFGAVFCEADIQWAMEQDVEPLFPESVFGVNP